jgi:hypothetical protein
MILQSLASLFRPILEQSTVRQIRRNHGLEHATIHILSRGRYSLSGRSSDSGFVLYGDAPTEKIELAIKEALRRFKRGEAQLAIHPNCGTNLVVSGFLTATIGALGFVGTTRQRAWERFPLVIIAMMLTVFYALPFGMEVQRHFTTSGEMGEMEFVSITRHEWRFLGYRLVMHRILTREA